MWPHPSDRLHITSNIYQSPVQCDRNIPNVSTSFTCPCSGGEDPVASRERSHQVRMPLIIEEGFDLPVKPVERGGHAQLYKGTDLERDSRLSPSSCSTHLMLPTIEFFALPGLINCMHIRRWATTRTLRA